MHTVVVVDLAFQPIRVRCDYCGSEHNYRGGPRTGAGARPLSERPLPPVEASRARHQDVRTQHPAPDAGHPVSPLPLVSERERRHSTMSADESGIDIEMLLRRVIREESGLTTVSPAEKWRSGDLVLRPGKPGVQEKSWPIETFFHKIVMLRNRLRTLEQQVNASDLPEDQKLKLQTYITGCSGSLTSFNVLFAEEDDKFVGAAD